MRMTFTNDAFYVKCAFDQRHVPKENGFLFDAKLGCWYTRHLRIAARLRDYADDKAKDFIDSKFIVYSPWAGAIPYPKNLTPYPFQINRAVPYALARNRSYLALDPGCGKTICAIIYLNALWAAEKIKSGVYVCPPFLVENVLSEFEKWAVGYTFGRYNKEDNEANKNFDVTILPDSLLSFRAGRTASHIAEFVDERVEPFDAGLIVDEAHRFKSPTAQRSQALYQGILPYVKHATFLSGTPMPNRPMELFPILDAAAPEVIDFRNKFEFGIKYCGGHKDKWGWKFDGATNMRELIPKLKEKFMLRIKKADVLPDLPEKREAVVFLDAKFPPKLAALERQILKAHSPQDLMKSTFGDEHLMTYRKLLGEHKVPKAVEYIKGLLEGSQESILIFAHHIDVVENLSWELEAYKPLIIAGYVPSDERFKRATRFQNGESRVLILNIQAGGIGFNLTRASQVVFVEYSWTPADNEQATDRAHRIGQKNPVLAHYLVYRNSLDAKILEANLKKQAITNLV